MSVNFPRYSNSQFLVEGTKPQAPNVEIIEKEDQGYMDVFIAEMDKAGIHINMIIEELFEFFTNNRNTVKEETFIQLIKQVSKLQVCCEPNRVIALLNSEETPQVKEYLFQWISEDLGKEESKYLTAYLVAYGKQASLIDLIKHFKDTDKLKEDRLIKNLKNELYFPELFKHLSERILLQRLSDTLDDSLSIKNIIKKIAEDLETDSPSLPKTLSNYLMCDFEHNENSLIDLVEYFKGFSETYHSRLFIGLYLVFFNDPDKKAKFKTLADLLQTEENPGSLEYF